MKRLLAMGVAVCALGPAADALGGQDSAACISRAATGTSSSMART